MYKVVLVDDEELIIEGMKQLTDWHQLGCEIAGIAYDGDEALDIINEVEPDILITDIRMPAMNGLKMIDYVRDRFPDMVIMLMSGYSEFEYAQQALEKGASCYMLKPVLERKLREYVGQAVNGLEQRKQKRKAEEELSVRLHQIKQEAREHFLRRIVKEELPDGYVRKLWGSMELCKPQDHIRLAILDTDVSLRENSASVLKFAIDNIADEICHQQNNFETASLDEERTVLLMMLEQKEEGSAGSNQFHTVIKAIQEMVLRFCNIPLSVGISAVYDFPVGLQTAYVDAENALKKRFHEANGLRIYEGPVKQQDVPYKEVRASGEKLLSAVNGRELKLVQLYLRRFCHLLFDTACISQEMIFDELKKLLMEYQDILLKYQNDSRDYERFQVVQTASLYRFKQAGALRRWFEEITIQVVETINQEGEDSATLIGKIKAYISENYQTATRQAVAEHFFLNPSYLSQLFKAETGEVFTDYVTRSRMEAAKQMLEERKYKMQYIAELVGYSSNQHFTRTFKKYTGMLPVEYRKNF